MLYVMLEAKDAQKNATFTQKSTIPDGRRRQRNVEIKPTQPPVGVGMRLGLSSAITYNSKELKF